MVNSYFITQANLVFQKFQLNYIQSHVIIRSSFFINVIQRFRVKLNLWICLILSVFDIIQIYICMKVHYLNINGSLSYDTLSQILY